MPCRGPRKRSRLMSPSTSRAARCACSRRDSASALKRGPMRSRRSEKAVVNSTTENSLALSFWLISEMVAKKMSSGMEAIGCLGPEVDGRLSGHGKREPGELFGVLTDGVARGLHLLIRILRQCRNRRLREHGGRGRQEQGRFPAGEFDLHTH